MNDEKEVTLESNNYSEENYEICAVCQYANLSYAGRWSCWLIITDGTSVDHIVSACGHCDKFKIQKPKDLSNEIDRIFSLKGK